MRSIRLVNVFMAGRRVGRLAQTREGICAFEYDAAWLTEGVSISPFELPLKNGVMLAKPTPFSGNFGVFDDCLPDGWGAILLNRYLQKQGIKPETLTIPDRLSLVGSSGRGALEFYPDQSAMRYDEYVSFEYLAAEAEKILGSKTYTGEALETLYRQGGSPGGARPKIFTRYEGKEWLVKFRALSDPEDVGETEYRHSLMAKQCGVEMPETRLFEGKFFAAERFDRLPATKIHTVSVAGLLNADYRIPLPDYLSIFQVCRMLTRNVMELWKLYRLMVFNFLIDNKDDHAKNFAFIMKEGEWHLSPAFDILPGDGINGYRTTSINQSIVPEASDLFTVAEQSGLERKKAIAIYDDMKEQIGRSC